MLYYFIFISLCTDAYVSIFFEYKNNHFLRINLFIHSGGQQKHRTGSLGHRWPGMLKHSLVPPIFRGGEQKMGHFLLTMPVAFEAADTKKFVTTLVKVKFKDHLYGSDVS